MAGCLAKSTLIGWREYYGGEGVGVDRHLCGAPQTRAFDPMLFQYWPTANFAGPTLKHIETHACRLCLVGTGSTVLCVPNTDLVKLFSLITLISGSTNEAIFRKLDQRTGILRIFSWGCSIILRNTIILHLSRHSMIKQHILAENIVYYIDSVVIIIVSVCRQKHFVTAHP